MAPIAVFDSFYAWQTVPLRASKSCEQPECAWMAHVTQSATESRSGVTRARQLAKNMDLHGL